MYVKGESKERPHLVVEAEKSYSRPSPAGQRVVSFTPSPKACEPGEPWCKAKSEGREAEVSKLKWRGRKRGLCVVFRSSLR